MARLVAICDTDVGSLAVTTDGVISCDAPGSNHGWITVEESQLDVQTFAELSLQDGGVLAGAIVGVWTIGYVCRLVMITIFRTRFG